MFGGGDGMKKSWAKEMMAASGDCVAQAKIFEAMKNERENPTPDKDEDDEPRYTEII